MRTPITTRNAARLNEKLLMPYLIGAPLARGRSSTRRRHARKLRASVQDDHDNPKNVRNPNVGSEGAMLRLGYKASAEQFPPRQLLEFAVHAEAVGFDSVMVSDHFQPWRHTDGHAPFSFAWLAALGERTSRAIIGTSVVTPTFRYHPAIVAQAIGTLGALYPGRVLLGVGTGESLNEVPATGMNWPPFKERFARLREAIELMRRLAREERVSFEGEYYRTERATIYDRPEVPVPIYVAASGALAARLAGRVGDGFICTSGKARELYTETLLPAVAEGLAKAGRDAGGIERVIEMKVSFDPDRERALEDTRHWAALALSPEEKTGIEDPVEMEKLADALPIERAASRWIVSSDPDEHIERLAETIDLGFTHLVFHAPGPDQRRFLDLYAEQVLPRLRARYGGAG
jgi:coenzyme F420-dependent glucose-6-phosphate dehydrogenase